MESLKNFSQLISEAKSNTTNLKIAVTSLSKPNTLLALHEASQLNLAIPYIVGVKKEIETAAKAAGINMDNMQLIYIDDHTTAIEKAIDLLRTNQCNALMKGDCSTAEMMSAVLKKENNLRGNTILSHMALIEIPNYHKLLFVTDSGINIKPSVEQRISITKNCINAAQSLMTSKPKVAVISFIEKASDKVPETLEAQYIANNTELRSISDIVGPISFDVAISKEAAQIKKFDSSVAGDADILSMPDITSANTLLKSFVYCANAKAAGIVLGAKIPIILTSRSDTHNNKLNSIALAKILA